MFIRSFGAIAVVRLAFAAFAIFAFFATAKAQFLTFVAATGVDTRPCTVQAQPCKTLQRAAAVTGAGGTIRILSDLPAQSTTLAKSLTVEGGGYSMIGTITINNASAVVALRNLALTGRGAVARGINIVSAAAVHIEDCTVERYTQDGIVLTGTGATDLFISDTVSRDNNNGLTVGNASAHVAVEKSRFEGNAQEGVRVNAAEVSINRSTASRNGFGIFISGGGTANITETVVVDSASYGFEIFTSATIAASVARGNGTGLFINTDVSVVLTDSVFTYNSTGINNKGILYTRENSTNLGNTTNYTGAGVVNTFGGV